MILRQFKNLSGSVYCTVSYDEENNCIHDTWTGMFGSQDNFRAVMNYIASMIEDKQITKWLADLSDMNGSFDGSKDWIVFEIMPKVMKAGLLFEAIVLPKNAFSKLSDKDTMIKIQNFEIRQFDDLPKAKAWLSESSTTTV